ncbi:PH domain-containing protein [Staphylococcus pettenkoferi]|uniref:PH domain-containing protein n=1 Tax=Staphylococcus pettenkoferi TaxID=170573 RepID=A0A9Q4H1I1_9STAP|nr:PH domain-containing protein [Staphylococcus pettenkoferi]MCY1569926.1 PH domain-containing protein [Staphylococcus pettenkoferi]MCY1576990.1 PH domain-containing protein [Staphylococcus pettenkoferi]MCY1594013.1 PH domain-containing protein [Staphylococcus pettenkoferi]
MDTFSNYQRSPRQVQKYYYIAQIVESVFLLLILGLFLFLTLHFHWWHWLIYVIAILGAIIIIDCIAEPLIDYRYTYFKVTDHYLAVDHRFFFKKQELVNIERIQYLIRHENPILHRMGLCKVEVVTAGHGVELPLIHETQVQEIEEHLLTKLKGVNTDV